MESNKLRGQKRLSDAERPSLGLGPPDVHCIALSPVCLSLHCHSNLEMLQAAPLVVLGWGGCLPCSPGLWCSSDTFDDLRVPYSIWHHPLLSLKNSAAHRKKKFLHFIAQGCDSHRSFPPTFLCLSWLHPSLSLASAEMTESRITPGPSLFIMSQVLVLLSKGVFL